MLTIIFRFLPIIVILVYFLIRFSIKKRNSNNEYLERMQRVGERINRNRRMQEEIYRRRTAFRPREGDTRSENIIANRPDLGQRQYVYRNDRWVFSNNTPGSEFISKDEMEID